jgi:hypothetical protein
MSNAVNPNDSWVLEPYVGAGEKNSKLDFPAPGWCHIQLCALKT